MSMIQGAAKKDVFTSSAIAKAALAIKKTDRNKNNTILNTIFCLPPLTNGTADSMPPETLDLFNQPSTAR